MWWLIKQLVKVNWHTTALLPQTVQLYSPGGANVPSHLGTLAPPDEYAWTCASFGQPKSTIQTANRSVCLFLHSSQQKVPILTMGPSCPKTALSDAAIWTHLIYGSSSPPESSTQTASRSVLPTLHRRPQGVPILYNGTPFPPPSKLPLPIGDLDQI